MKVNQRTIPTLVRTRQEFTNGSGTLRGIVNPSPEIIRTLIACGDMDEGEAQELQYDSREGITYLVVSYQIALAWERYGGAVHINEQSLTQTSERHRMLMSEFSAPLSTD